MTIHELMEYGIVRIINQHRPTQEQLLEDLKPRRDKDQRPKDRKLDQWISRLTQNTTALHGVCTIK